MIEYLNRNQTAENKENFIQKIFINYWQGETLIDSKSQENSRTSKYFSCLWFYDKKGREGERERGREEGKNKNENRHFKDRKKSKIEFLTGTDTKISIPNIEIDNYDDVQGNSEKLNSTSSSPKIGSLTENNTYVYDPKVSKNLSEITREVGGGFSFQ